MQEYLGDGPPPVPQQNVSGRTPEEQGSNVPLNFRPTLAKPMPPVRCTGIVRNGEREGLRCNRWSIAGANVCLKHGGQLPNVRKAAEERVDALRRYMIEHAEEAVETMFSLLKEGVENNVRLGAAKEIANIVGLKANADITVEVNHNVSPSEVIHERLAQIRERSIESKKKQQAAEEEDVFYAEEVDPSQDS